MIKKILLYALIILSVFSCEDKTEKIETVIDPLSNTTWTRKLIKDSGEHYGYESYEFFNSGDFTLSEYDLYGIRQKYLIIGEYILNGSKIVCNYKRTHNTPYYYPGDEFSLDLNFEIKTIIPSFIVNDRLFIFVKQ